MGNGSAKGTIIIRRIRYGFANSNPEREHGSNSLALLSDPLVRVERATMGNLRNEYDQNQAGSSILIPSSSPITML